MPSPVAPGPYTIRWMVDTRNGQGLQPLRVAQLASYSLQPRIGTLSGNAVQPTDAEVIVNRLANDVLTGVVRLQVTSATTREAIGERILDALRTGGVPDAAAHLGATEWGPGAAFFSPALALVGAPIAALASVSGESGRQAFRGRFGSVVIELTPRVDNEARPSSSSSAVGAVANLASRRVSADPAREGTIGGTALSDAADAARRATELSPVTIALLVTGGAVVVALVGLAVYREFKR